MSLIKPFTSCGLPKMIPPRNAKAKLSIDDYSAIRVQALARNEAAILTCEENETCRNLTRLSRTAHWCATELLLGLFGHSGWNKRRPN